ncbi:unnamed protein product [Bursaphelenchus okinawaensis]|uniref:Uncharacterized protein n=1 Tax=Bursaphelenchus okinawaensis TaxID=465554 RepID=A0A811LH51_9BILA|nr:unnamed protein product [Bursaphelenchus okinawaensis]CAG9123712.1 unnamed protein product [Bursaphelenchus okinawaensis]
MSFLFDTFRPTNKPFLDSFYESSKENRALDGFKWASSALKSVLNADNSAEVKSEMSSLYKSADESFNSFETAKNSPVSVKSMNFNTPQKSSSTPTRKSLSARYLEAKGELKNNEKEQDKDVKVDQSTVKNSVVNVEKSPEQKKVLEVVSDFEKTPLPVGIKEALPALPEEPDSSFYNKSLSFYMKMAEDAESTTSEDSLELNEDTQTDQLSPIRHSLLHLVAEEDIPEILEAMAEEVG